MNFGLGLVLSFTDNASAGINNAVNSLNQLTQTAERASASLDQMASLSALSVVTDQMGSSFVDAGATIISTLSSVVKEVTDTGTTLMYAGNQLQMLYSDLGEGAGEMMLGKIQQYAKESIFAFEDLIPVVTSLKSVGIEAFDNIATSTGSANQTLMDYASDLAAFAPQMRNAYGTGIKAAMGALREYIAEGNALSLKRGAGIDITSILGEAKGSTIEERSQQVADLIEKLGMLGMTASLAGTPMQRLSNMGDVLFQTIAKISDSGVYDKFTSLIEKLSEYIFAIPDEELDNIAKVIGGALTTIMTPLEWVIDEVLSLADSFRELIKTRPNLVKFATVGVAVTGALLVIAGVALKATSAFSGLSLMLLTLGKDFKSLGGLIATGSLRILATLLPIATAIGLIALAWKNDFAGIKTTLTTFINDIVEIAKLLIDAWDFNLSDENFQKAKELGIMPLIEAILDLRYRFDFFKDGFISGWEEIGKKVENIVSKLLEPIKKLGFTDLTGKFTEFLQIFSGSSTQSAFDLGEKFANITIALSGLLAGFVAFKKVAKIFSGITAIVKPLLSLIVAHPIVALVVALVGALALLYAKCEPFREFVNELFGTIKDSLSSIVEPMREVFMSLLLSAIPIVKQLIGAFKEFLPQVMSFIPQVVGLISNVLNAVIELVIGVLPAVMNVMGTLVNTFIALLPTLMSIWTAIMNVIEAVIPIVTQLIDMLVPFITELVTLLSQLVANILPIIVNLIDEIVPLIMDVVSLILPMLQDIVTSLLPVIQTVLTVVISLVRKLLPIIQTVVSVVAEIIAMVVKVAAVVIPIITQIVQMIVNILIPIIDAIVTAIGFVIDIVVGIVQIVVSVIAQIITIITGIIEVIVSILGAIIQAIMVVVEVIVGIVTTIIETIVNIIKGIIVAVQTVWDGIVAVFSGAIDFFTGVFEAVFESVSSIFTKIGDFFTEVWNKVVNLFNTIGDAIGDSIKSAINFVLEGAINIINGFINAINLAIGVINAIPGVSISKLSTLEVPQLAQGGVVDKPTMSVIGEAGAEAVMPLENNLGWIGKLAGMITEKMDNIRPVNTSQMTTTNNSNMNQRYLTNNNSNTHNTYEGDTDNSVTFNEGAIQLTVQNASEEEAIRMAKKIMEYIKRRKELDDMANYA